MPIDVILGLQWGDEGKGKLVDLMTDDYDVIVRYQGGDNAGHTVVRGDLVLKFHLIPSGIATPGKRVVIGHGVVLNMISLCRELDELDGHGIPYDNLLIAERAFAVLPSHRREDERREKGDVPIGTTGRGIGPAYQDKYARTGIRIGDFLEPDIAERLVAKGLSPDEVKEQIRLFERIRGHVVDTVTMLQTAERNGAKILLEGAQGVMLDVDFGTYPYVTSSSPNTAGGFLGTGLPIRAVNRIVGVMKAYTTRVGHGPFPTELTDAIGERLREQGREFGTTTGRARRCGWLDFAQLRFAIRVCDCTELAVMKLDVLTGLDELRFAKNYLLDGAAIEGYPARLSQLEKVVAEWDALPGWTEPVAGCRAWNQLPARATEYLRMIEKNTGCPIRTVSTSPDREDTIVLDR